MKPMEKQIDENDQL